ncbi:la-related protein 7 [Aphis gossypii]|uniref:la-related protein 7 n=1 Tax=Aphis gossypii TaxID=80765 RepID=UPI00100F975A|nr:la-related protein 7 [Aphis gossypii]XP_027849524.1 la-related protein 7 [Aphis gossypii]XP_050058929.1 la-related protein 7 [Aphis gossypii]
MEPSSDISIESVEENVLKSSLNRVRKRKKQLYTDLKQLMEFYLSDANLRKDRFFGNLLQTSQCISINTFLNCNKIKSLTQNPEDIIKALENSNVLSVSDCKTKIYRIKPIEDKTPEDIERCTIYVEQLPPKADHDWIKSMFEKYGSVAYISLPKFKSGIIKRFAFIEFDNEESAVKVLEEYKKLHAVSKILPEELQSIITFKEDEDKNVIDESTNDDNLLKKRKHSISVEDVEGVEKKIKKETLQVSCSGIKNNKKKKKKDKNKKSDLDDEQKNSSFEISDSENNQKALIENADTSTLKLAEAITSDDDKKDISIEQNNTESIIKKKRKRNKGKKVKLDTNLTSPVLRIMSKTEWRKLRNQFLNMQRQKMSLLKAQLRRPKYNENFNAKYCEKTDKNNEAITNVENVNVDLPKNNDIRVKYEPGVILKIEFANPIESDKIFKTEAKTDSRVKFVDVVHNSEAYVRCDCQETAINIAKENRWPQTRLLKGEEEKLYWDKILRDREMKCVKQKETKKPRGREKLIKKAEKRLAQHVTFNEEDNE